MAAEPHLPPAPPPVVALPPLPGDEHADIARQLETERSAGKALLTALGELERDLRAERGRVTELETALAEAQQEAEKTGRELTARNKQTMTLFNDLEQTRNELCWELDKPFWRRVLNR